MDLAAMTPEVVDLPVFARLSALACDLSGAGRIVTQIHTLGEAPAMWGYGDINAFVYPSDDCRVVTEDGTEHRIETI